MTANFANLGPVTKLTIPDHSGLFSFIPKTIILHL